MKAFLRRKFTAIPAFLRKEKKSEINNFPYHLKELVKEEPTKPEASTRKEIINFGEETNKIDCQKNRKKINKTRNWFFERVKKIGKPLHWLN